MKRKTMLMFAATSEDLPLFSGYDVTPLVEPEPVTIMQYDGAYYEAWAILETSGIEGLYRIEEWINRHDVVTSRTIRGYTLAMMNYARQYGISVSEKPNVTYNGWYYLSDAIHNAS